MTPRILLLPLLCTSLLAGEQTASKQLFRIEHRFEATVLPTEPVLFALEPEEWTTFTITSLAEHGTAMKKGETVITFEREGYDHKLEDLKRTVAVKELEVGRQEIDVAKLEEETKIQIAGLLEAKEATAQDLDYFIKVGRPAAEASVEQGLKGSRYSLASAEEELKQLKQMYEEDDLTEETEEIILKRQIFQVERAKFSLERAERDAKQTLETELPRQLKQYQQAAQLAAIAHAKGASNLPSVLQAAKLELEGTKVSLARLKADLDQLTEEGAWFEWKAPADGTVFHGGLQDGEWQYGDLAKSLKLRGTAPLRKTLVSLVPNGAAKHLATKVDAAIALDLQPGETLLAKQDAGEPLSLQAKVDTVDTVPGPDGKYQVTLKVTWPETGAPTSSTKLECIHVAYENPEAITVPPSTLTATAEGSWVVEVKLADGKTEMRPVKVGRMTDDLVEITEGLEDGQVVINKKQA